MRLNFVAGYMQKLSEGTVPRPHLERMYLAASIKLYGKSDEFTKVLKRKLIEQYSKETYIPASEFMKRPFTNGQGNGFRY